MQNQEPAVKDNVEEFGMKIPSADEQKKILAQIQQEESIDFTIQRKEEDAIYLEDEPEKVLEKLLTLSQFNVQERTAYVKHLCELIQLVGIESLTKFGDIIDQILNDSDEMKKILLSQFGLIRQFFSQQEQENNEQELIKKYLLPVLLKLLRYHNYDIQTQATTEIAIVAALLSRKDRDELILKEIIILAHDEQQEQNKLIALQFFGATAKVIGTEFIESFIALELISAGEDERIRVRKEAIFQTPLVAKEATPECFKQKLLPFYLLKCEDKSSWQIRKACAEVIVQMSEIASTEVRENELSTKMLQLLKDGNKWVKASSYLKLGAFIETLRDSSVPNDQLLIEYCKCTNKDIQDYFTSEAEILEVCAYNFPAVLKVFGAKKWPPLFKLYQQLIKVNNKDVRKPLACGFHEIAKIVGVKNAEKDLILILDCFLKELNDEVKLGATVKLWEFIQIFDEDKRDNLLDIFLIIQKDQKKWRIRETIAKQIHHLVPLYQPEIIFQIIVPITLKLCNDIVAVVRKHAAKQMYSLLQALDKKDDELCGIYHQCLIENIKAFGVSSRFNQRQAFVLMCQNLMKMKEFETQFLESFVVLCQDPVRNVRISVAKVIIKHMLKKGRYTEHLAIKRMIQYLMKDKEPEVITILNSAL